MPALATIPAGHEQARLSDLEKALRLCTCGKAPGDRSPPVAAHRGGALVPAANAEGHPLGDLADEIRMEQHLELLLFPAASAA